MYEDYGDYYEPTLAEEIFEEAKARLEQALKEDVKRDVEKSLDIVKNQEIRKVELDDRERKIYFKEKELERRFNDLENEFKKEKLDNFIKHLQNYLGQTYYKIKEESIRKAKCDACDDKRKYEVEMPDGTIRKIDCSCNKAIYSYIVEEVSIFDIRIRKENKEITTYLRYLPSLDERLEKILPEEIYNKFENVKIQTDGCNFRHDSLYKTYYTNKEEAQKHADYLNNKKDSKNGN